MRNPRESGEPKPRALRLTVHAFLLEHPSIRARHGTLYYDALDGTRDRVMPLPILKDVLECQVCVDYLPLGPRPLLKIDEDARILVIGQAPGRKAHESEIPWNDPSGDRLRDWLGVSRETFYDDPRLGLMPMGFCFPGTGKSGDLPPRPECYETWHQALLAAMPKVEMTLLIGKYALERYHPRGRGSVTDVVSRWEDDFPTYVPLPHPSPRNNRWLKRNPWFVQEVLPALGAEVARVLD